MGISKRLRTIIDLVTDGYTVSDIGTDHGYVPVSLLREEKSPFVIAVDVSKGSLLKALQNAIRAGVSIRQNDFVKEAAVGLPEESRLRLEEIVSGQLKKGAGCIEFRLSDGLSSLTPGEADCLILSGMGGILMCRILAAHPETAAGAKELILSPHRDAELVRAYVEAQGFSVVHDEELMDKKKSYRIIRAVRPLQENCPGQMYSHYIKPEHP